MSLLPLVAAAHHGDGHDGASSTRRRSLADGDDSGNRGAVPGLATNEILGAGLKDVVMHEVPFVFRFSFFLLHSTCAIFVHYLDCCKYMQVFSRQSIPWILSQ